jgi:hypothetical protein
MKKQLDDLIRNNAGQFTPRATDGHFERFGTRQRMRGKKRHVLNTVFRIAATVLLGLIIAYAAVREFNVIHNRFGIADAEISSPELKEAEQFYTTQLSAYYDKIQHLRFNNDQTEKRQILKELTDMDKQVKSMKMDLRQNPDDERIEHAIINFYQVKIELMDMIIARTEQTTSAIL